MLPIFEAGNIMNVPHGEVRFVTLSSLVLASADDELYIWKGGREQLMLTGGLQS